MAQINVTIDIPDAFASVINDWRLNQKKPDGSLIYPTVQSLLKAWIRSHAREIIAVQSAESIT